ncbi:MAG: 2-C-methyl-D-erythritol 2,4-cyclodiphosphate synthase [Gammaproteobacteria bacterium]|jgi:2-C-methyl-D-erythritol 2,4-cyclodiphosphate synthase
MRIGHGYDAHRFGPGSFVILGGVTIPHKRGIEAHSDGDVVLHALCDALLGAAGMGDIGQHFPDTDEAYRGVSSRDLLRNVVGKLKVAALRVGNVDLTIVAQRPRLAEHLPAMRANVARDLEVDEARVNLKATTTERMGFVGREEGIATHAVALLVE